jgi:hypothetical protein
LAIYVMSATQAWFGGSTQRFVRQVLLHRQVMVRIDRGFKVSFCLQRKAFRDAEARRENGLPKSPAPQVRLHAQRPIRLETLRMHRLNSDFQARVLLHRCSPIG